MAIRVESNGENKNVVTYAAKPVLCPTLCRNTKSLASLDRTVVYHYTEILTGGTDNIVAVTELFGTTI